MDWKCPECGEQNDGAVVVCICGHQDSEPDRGKRPGQEAQKEGDTTSLPVQADRLRQGQDHLKGTFGTGTFAMMGRRVNYPLNMLFLVIGPAMVYSGIAILTPDLSVGDPTRILSGVLVMLGGIITIFCLVALFSTVRSGSIAFDEMSMTFRRESFSTREWVIAYADIEDITYQVETYLGARVAASKFIPYEDAVARALVKYESHEVRRGMVGKTYDFDIDEVNRSHERAYLCFVKTRNGSRYTIKEEDFSREDFAKIIALIEGNSRRASKRGLHD